ncbi:enoyl-CoA hydratase [Amycolatopsis mediterranei S699]|uniref:enoyl-CoA hydratase n=2 Tax=Amycolatopsis mediterranei TaxID=33910 RepID=A0A0H3DF52_AMYMU|nr:enoyl-CoA hydratase/isomerase family protein [Amycolatopsis mediterranei]ADJ48842.1 enoyl-CoA hydratase [Amycolatopsis mediterranei U32]AEK45788.1 enoyl-CoA hydratase [Amycolatopsis mediterranei S699]AFO80552.1 enoyl-CoA hydratase [Amycolatopsis mediterranei S699]AGT87680.1 enoyl-CoA hydratase [Amycolatopsis mediterranei RB]KDU94043.1 enoyl-CoA hydratase [Amycolatopsis mediterranei]
MNVTLTPHPDEERLAVLRIDRPPVNALSQSMWDALLKVGAQLHDAASPYRAVVIAGGRHFAVGADVKEMLPLTPAEFSTRNRVLQRAFHLVATAPQVTVAAITGYALGGGCELALAADFRVAGRGAVLGLPEITLGIMPGSGGTQRLGRIVGHARAKDLILSGRQIRAAEALEIGLVHHVTEDETVYAAAVERALAYARGPIALRYAKQALDADLPIDAGLALEAHLITACFASEDGQHGLRSFVENGPGKATW